VRSFLTALVTLLLLLGSRSAQAQPATQLTVSGSPAAMNVTVTVAGSQPAAVVNSATTYFVRAKNSSGPQKITAQLNLPMPANTTLSIQLAPTAGATSRGAVALDMTNRDVVVNIDKENGATAGITYTFSATVAAGVVPSQSRTVTLTLVNYP
jgi:hypothetical protein